MKILNESIENLTHADVVAFCQEGCREGVQIDYKKEYPSKGIAKHLAAFSNTRGGLLIIGVEEDVKSGIPVAWEGVVCDAKLLEKINQEIGNVEPIPSCIVRATDEVDGKKFVLVRVFEGDKTPYYVQNDSNVWVRTGNVSKPIDIASPDGLELLFGKNGKAEKARTILFERMENVFTSNVELNEKKRLREIQEAKNKADGSESRYLQTRIGENAKKLTIAIQPFFPKKAFTKPSNIKDSIGDLQFNRFPDYNMKPMPEGVQSFMYGYDGYFESQQIYAHGLVSIAINASRVGQNGVAYIPAWLIAGKLFSVLKVAQKFYSKFGYQGTLIGHIELENTKDAFFKEITSSRYIFRDEARECLLGSYKWEIEIDTMVLNDEKKFLEWYLEFLENIYWDLGFETFVKEIVLEFLKENNYIS